MEYPEWLDMFLWKEYVKARIKCKKPMTTFAEELNIQKLAKVMKQGYSQKKIMENVIEKGWQGIYAPIENNKHKAEAAPIQPYVSRAYDPEARKRDMRKLFTPKEMP